MKRYEIYAVRSTISTVRMWIEATNRSDARRKFLKLEAEGEIGWEGKHVQQPSFRHIAEVTKED